MRPVVVVIVLVVLWLSCNVMLFGWLGLDRSRALLARQSSRLRQAWSMRR